MLDLSSLNANQVNAVNWTDGPLLVLRDLVPARRGS